MLQLRLILRLSVAGSLALAVPAAALRPASAQPAARPAARPDKQKLAKQYVDSGLAAQAAGDYDTALTFYNKAYELVPHPLLLFNMAQAHRLAGRLTAARDLYLQYLDIEPRGAQSRTANEHVTALEAQIAAEAESSRQAEAAKQTEAARQAEAAKQAEAARRAEAARQAEAAKEAERARAAAARREAEERSGRGKTLRLAGLVSGGVGLAGLGAGVFFQLRASQISDDFSTPGTEYDPAKDSDGEDAERWMVVSYAAGTALLAGGAALYFFGRRAQRSDEHDRLTFAPSFSSDSVGLVVIGGLP